MGNQVSAFEAITETIIIDKKNKLKKIIINK